MDKEYQSKQSDYYAQQRAEMIQFVPTATKTLLDVGCARGHFAKAVKQKLGCTTYGIELQAEAAQVARTNLDFFVEGDIAAGLSQWADQQFDCVSFNDVLEHMTDPWSALSLLKPHLSETGVVVASIPNVLHTSVLKPLLFEQDWKYQSDGVLDKTHLRFFTKKSILRMFDETGYSVRKIVGINTTKRKNRIHWLNKLVFMGRLDDAQHLQFAVVAEPK